MKKGLKVVGQEDVKVEIQAAWRNYYFSTVVSHWKRLFLEYGDPKTFAETDIFLRQMYLFKEVYDEENDCYFRVLHTLRAGETEVSDKEFRFFCSQCIQKAAELCWEIPFPSELINSKL